MSANQARFRVATMARVFGVSPSGYYAWRRRPPSARARADAELRARVQAIHGRSRGTYGAPRIHAELTAAGVAVSRKRVARVMRSVGVAGVSRRRGPRTTRRNAQARPAPDRVERRFEADAPNRLWVADITYVPTLAGFLYLAIVLDVFSRRVVGWAMAGHLRTALVVEVLEMAVDQRRPVAVIHHSDQGDTAVKARSAAIITLKTLIVNAPDALRETLGPLTDRQLIDRCAALRPGDIIDPTASVKHALRALATRWRTLSVEIATHDKALDTITRAAAPTLHEAFGISTDSVAEMMIVAGDNPTRIRSEAAFAKLCGACPVPASSGVTNRHRLFRGGHRQANAALYRIVIVRMRWHQPTIDYVRRRTVEGLSKKDIIRCLKRFVAREVYNALIDDHKVSPGCAEAA